MYPIFALAERARKAWRHAHAHTDRRTDRQTHTHTHTRLLTQVPDPEVPVALSGLWQGDASPAAAVAR